MPSYGLLPGDQTVPCAPRTKQSFTSNLRPLSRDGAEGNSLNPPPDEVDCRTRKEKFHEREFLHSLAGLVPPVLRNLSNKVPACFGQDTFLENTLDSLESATGTVIFLRVLSS
jgi:hypothetical protein